MNFSLQMLRSYFKKFDPDEPPIPGIDDDDELGSQRRHKKEYDPNSLEERWVGPQFVIYVQLDEVEMHEVFLEHE